MPRAHRILRAGSGCAISGCAAGIVPVILAGDMVSHALFPGAGAGLLLVAALAMSGCGGGGGGGAAAVAPPPPPPPSKCQPPPPSSLDLVGEWSYGNASAVAAVSLPGSAGSLTVTHRVALGSGGCVFLFDADLPATPGIASIHLATPHAAAGPIDEICIPGGFVYDLASTATRLHVAGGQGGYHLVDTSGPPFPILASLPVAPPSGGGLSGAPVSILLATAGGVPYVFLGLATGSVAAVDLSVETAPVVRCEIPLSGIPQGLDTFPVAGKTWLAAASSCGGVDFVPLDGLPACPPPSAVVNLCPAGANPSLDCTVGIAGCAGAETRDVQAFVRGATPYAAVVLNCFGLRVFDLTPLGQTPPAAPALVGCYARNGNFWLSSVVIDQNRWAYLGYDESNGGRYQVLGYPCPVPPERLPCRLCPWETACKGYPSETSAKFAGLEVVDLSDPAHPVATSTTTATHHGGIRRAAVVDGTYVHVAKYFQGWEVLQSLPPAAPVPVAGGILDQGAGLPLHGTTWVEGSTSDPSLLPMATEHNLQLVDVSDPTRPGWIVDPATGDPTGFLTNQDANPKAQVVQVAELAGHVYTGSFASDFDVFRIDDPTQILDVADVGMPAACMDPGGGFLPFNARHVVARAQIGIPPRDVLFVAGATPFVKNCFRSSLATFDLADPAAPLGLGTLTPPAEDVLVLGVGLSPAGDRAYLPYLRNPCAYLACPPGTWPPPLPCPASPQDFAQAGGLLIANVSDPAAPVPLGSLPLPGQPWRVAVHGNLAFVAAMCGGLQVVDVSNDLAPFLAASYTNFPSWVFDVDVEKAPSGALYAVLAVFDAGVFVYQFVGEDPTCGYPIATYPAAAAAGAPSGIWMGAFEGQGNAVWIGPGPKRYIHVAKREGLVILDLPDDDD